MLHHHATTAKATTNRKATGGQLNFIGDNPGAGHGVGAMGGNGGHNGGPVNGNIDNPSASAACDIDNPTTA